MHTSASYLLKTHNCYILLVAHTRGTQARLLYCKPRRHAWEVDQRHVQVNPAPRGQHHRPGWCVFMCSRDLDYVSHSAS